MNNTAATAQKELAPAVFIGTQSGFGIMPDMDLFNLTRDIEGHPEGSTVSRQTLEAHGFLVPTNPTTV